MKFAMTGVGSGSTVRPAPMIQVAQKAEKLGFESLWIPEHLAIPLTVDTPYPYSADGQFPGGPDARLHDLQRTAELGDGWVGVRHSPDSVKPLLARLKELVEGAKRDFSTFDITVGVGAGVPDLDTVKRFEDAGVHRLVVFAPGFVPRSRFETELFPQMERFAAEVLAKV